MVFAKDAPTAPPAKAFGEYLQVLKDKDAWWFMFFYSVTFGGFSGLASSLTIYFNSEYGLSPVTAGYFTAACVFAGSMVRPLGGVIADRIGGIKTLSLMYTLATLFLFIASFGMQSYVVALAVFVLAMLALGTGNGAVFQLVPQRFRKEIGVMTGLVGMAGGIGGFYLASSLGYSRQLTGSYQLGLMIFAALGAAALVGLASVKGRWRTTWGRRGWRSSPGWRAGSTPRRTTGRWRPARSASSPGASTFSIRRRTRTGSSPCSNGAWSLPKCRRGPSRGPAIFLIATGSSPD